MDSFKDGTTIVCLSLILIFIGAIFGLSYYENNVEKPAAFKAWEKQTGNPKELTFEEWKVLLKVTKRDDLNLIIVR